MCDLALFSVFCQKPFFVIDAVSESVATTTKSRTGRLLSEAFLGAFTKLRKATMSFVMSVLLSAWNNSAPTGRIVMKFDIWVFLNVSRKFKFHWNPTIITGTLHGQVFTFMVISRWIILRMRNVSDKSCRENQKTKKQVTFFWKSCLLRDNV